MRGEGRRGKEEERKTIRAIGIIAYSLSRRASHISLNYGITTKRRKKGRSQKPKSNTKSNTKMENTLCVGSD